MEKLRGLFIEDDKDNVEVYSMYFEDEGIEIICLEKLFDSPEDYYDYICDNDIDFVVIDTHLNIAGVSYDGFSVLKAIRDQDSDIYILLLTNDPFDHKENLGEFDQTILKKEFEKEFMEIIARIKRASSRKLSKETEEILLIRLENEERLMMKELEEMKKLNEELEKIVKKC